MKQIATTIILFALSAYSLAEENASLPVFSAGLKQIEPKHVNANGIDIAYKVLGDPENPAVLMIMGLSGSHILWGDTLPNHLVDAGYQVVLFDNRDVGDSQRFSEYGDPMIWWELLKNKFGFDVSGPYDLDDMARDSVALLDELQMKQVHVVGASMGGMIAQVVAAQYPDRVSSLTSIMSSPAMFADYLPPPGTPDEDSPFATDNLDDDAIDALKTFGIYPDSAPRQMMAIMKSGDRSDEVKTISAPTLVMHGEDDAIVPLPHGKYTADLIKGSKFVSFQNMAHDMPAEVMPALVSNMIMHMKGNDI